MLLFEGSAPALSILFKQCLNITLSKASLVLVVIPGNIHLRHLSSFTELHWLKIKHSLCGGVTSTSTWLGFNHSLRDKRRSSPVYCNQALSDILEFAPSGARVMPVTGFTLSSLKRTPSALPHASMSNTWWCNGLLPLAAITLTSKPVTHVVTPSPFTNTGWCTRALTARELARCFDLPVTA